MTTITLSPDQQSAMDDAVARIRARQQCVTFGGYAGTGKSTIQGEIVKALRPEFPRIAFACFTGKAYKVLEAKLIAAEALKQGDYCGTIHGLVYDARKNRIRKEREGLTIEENRYTFHDREENDDFNLIVVDEASMVNEDLYNKLLEFGAPILAVGDHGQLPPIHGEFNLMANPQIRLTKIHRQAENDPIVKLSIMAREDGKIPYGDYHVGDRICMKIHDESKVNDHVDPREWTVIAGTNKKRVERNKWARWKLDRKGDVPVTGDRVVCLKNIRQANVFNGMTGTVTACAPSNWLSGKYKALHFLNMMVAMDADFPYASSAVLRWQFHREKALRETIVHPADARELDPDDFWHQWDFGYCLTAHKSQGSEFDNVVVCEESGMRRMMERTMGDEGWRRWLYTAITRAKKQLIIVEE